MTGPRVGWVPPPRPGRAVLAGRLVRLEPLAPAHAAAFHAGFCGHDGLWDFMPCGPFADAADYAGWVSRMAGGDDPQVVALVDPATGAAGGVAAYLRISPEAGSIEPGHICLSPALQRRPAATEAFFLMMRQAFALGYRRFEWTCDAANAPSRRAALRLRFAFEGVFRQAGVVKGRNRDTAWYTVIDGEWPALAAAFDRWLAPANSGADGRQVDRLSALTAAALAPLRAAAAG